MKPLRFAQPTQDYQTEARQLRLAELQKPAAHWPPLWSIGLSLILWLLIVLLFLLAWGCTTSPTSPTDPEQQWVCHEGAPPPGCQLYAGLWFCVPPAQPPAEICGWAP